MTRWALAVILVTFVGLCCMFNTATPYRQAGILKYSRDPKTGGPQAVIDVGAPDERQHANYIAYLRAGKGFPVLRPGSADLGEMYQAHQPPAYYLLATAWCSISGSDPTASSGGFPLRLLNTLIGCVGLLGIYWLVRWGNFDEPVALAATVAGAFLPMNVALHSAVSNDPLLYALITWGLAFIVRGLNERERTSAPWIAGLFLGLAILTKTTGLALAPVLGVAGLMAAQSKAKLWFTWWAAILVGLAIASPWLIRNLNLYGDPFAISAFTTAFTGNPQAKLFIEAGGIVNYLTNMVAWYTSRSFVGAFGYMDIFMFETMGSQKSGSLYNAIWAVMLIVMAGPFLAPRIGTPESGGREVSHRNFWIPAVTLALVVLALFFRFNLQYFQGQARYLYPAISVFAVAVGYGATKWGKSNRGHVWIVLAVAMIALDLAAWGQLSDAFALRTVSTGTP